MKIGQFTALLFASLLGFSLFFAGVQAEDTISYADPAGDVENDGLDPAIGSNVDILAISIDTSSDPIELTLTVSGSIDYSGEGMIYVFMFFLDQVGDGSESTAVTVSLNTGTFSSDYGSMFGFGLEISGNGTDTLTVSVPKNSIDAETHPVQDIYGMVEVTDYGTYGYAIDTINDDFGNIEPVDDDPDDDTDDDDWDDDDWDEDMIPDPLKETPTDTSISVDIENADISIDIGDEMFEVEQTIDGTTTGTVDHCSMTIVTYYKDGTYDADDWNIGPEDNPKESFMGITFENHFYGTGSEGQDDWLKWELYNYAKAPSEMLDDVLEESEELESGNITSIHIVIRAYSDESETMWNQDSSDVTDDFMKAIQGDDGDDNGLPAPGVMFIIGTFVLIAMLGIATSYRKR